MSNNNEFFFTNSDLNEDNIAKFTLDALKDHDDGEIYLEYSESEFISLSDGLVKTVNYDTNSGFGLRGIIGEICGFGYSSDISKNAFNRAKETINSIKLGQASHLDVSKIRLPKNNFYVSTNPNNYGEFLDKVNLLQKIDKYIRDKEPNIRQVSASISTDWQIVKIITKDGRILDDIRPMVSFRTNAVIEKDGRLESGSSSLSGRYMPDIFFKEKTWQSQADESLRQARLNLNSKLTPAGDLPVLLGNGWPGVLLHEAVGHGLEGDFNRKKTSTFSNLMGKQVASKGVTVIDDGTLEHNRGSLNFDDEGTPTQRNILIEDGILVNYMQDRLNARLMNMSPTGNGRRESYACEPMPRMTNTFMLEGDKSLDELLSMIDFGIYAVNFSGGRVDITSGKFTFTATECYLVEKGKIKHPLKGATITGNGPDVMRKIKAIGNDLKLSKSTGTCGKNGQSVPVGIGQPSLLIDKITVGGTEF